MKRLVEFLSRDGGPPGKDLLFLTIVFAAAMLPFIAWPALLEPDECRYGEIPREMLESGDFLTPRLNYVKYFEKPPLFYWMNAGSMALLGKNELAVRLPTALAALGTILIVYLAGRRLFGRRAGMLAALILGICAGHHALGRIAITDMTLTFLLTASLALFLIAARQDDPAPRKGLFYHLFYLTIALAVLTKGLIGLVFPGGIIFFHLLATRRWRLLAEMRLLTGIPLFFLVAAPWFVLVSRQNPEFARFFFIHEHFDRFLTESHERNKGMWFPAAMFLLLFLPWTPLLALAARRSIADRRGGRAGERLFLLLWVGIIVVFFTFSKSQLAPYLLPALPAAALLLGETFSEIIEGRLAPRPPFRFLVGQGSTKFLAIMLMAWLPLQAAATTLVIATQKRTTKDLALLCRKEAPDGAVLASLWFERGLCFYAERRVVLVGRDVTRVDELEFGSQQGDQTFWFRDRPRFLELWDSERTVFALMESKDMEELRGRMKTPPRVLGQDPQRRSVLASNR